MSLNKRLKLFAEQSNQSILSIEKAIGTRSTIQNAIDNNTNVGVKWITKILETYPELSAEWLMRGNGSMAYDKHGVLQCVEAIKENPQHFLDNLAFQEAVKNIKENKVIEDLKQRMKSIEDKIKD